jgi:hypothetical protein
LHQFMKKYRDKASSLLSGFGRIVFRGLLRLLMYYEGMAEYWSRQGMPHRAVGLSYLEDGETIQREAADLFR